MQSPNQHSPNNRSLPLVSIICLCYNQEKFVQETLQSVINQTYSNIELVIVDDGSTDGSVAKIIEWIGNHPKARFIPMDANKGMCTAFNEGLKQTTGDFIIDLAADDVLLPHRIERQVQAFEQLDNTWGVVFTDATIIDEESRVIGQFYSRNADGSLQKPVSSGDVYTSILQRYFICTPTMMSRRAVYEALGGYDEGLCYEDFDFWVRSSRQFKYFFLDDPLTLKRQSAHSDSTKWYRRRNNPHLESTLKVCWKAYQLNQNERENLALAQNVRYHLRQALFTENFSLTRSYGALLKKITQLKLADRAFLTLAKYEIPLFWLYRYYMQWRYAKKVRG